MMATPKRRRQDPCTPEEQAVAERTLPTSALLSAVPPPCRLLRRDILNLSFIRRVTQLGGVVPPCILAYLNIRNIKDDQSPPLSLVHPATPAALSFLDDHMSRFGDDLGEYYPVTSRGGLALLRSRYVSRKLYNLCVYDPVTGHRTFLSSLPGICHSQVGCFDGCVLLTPADGIGCSFLLFMSYPVPTLDSSNPITIKVHTTTSMNGTWSDAVTSDNNIGFLLEYWQAIGHGIVVLHGGTIHWLVHDRREIVFYNVCTEEHGTIKLPDVATDFGGQLHLGSYYSHDKQKLLILLAACVLKISVWHQLPGGDWASEAVMINMEEKLRLLDPGIRTDWPLHIEFKYSGDGSNVVLLHLKLYSSKWQIVRRTVLITLDLETKDMRVQHYSTSSSVLLEVDLPSRLRAMKVYP